jgi:hypothetical protein
VIFWIWLVILPAISPIAVQCPEGSRFDPGGYYVTCNNTPLTSFPSIGLTGVQQLQLINNNNNIKFWRREFFKRTD